jgi:hypothetical protein
MRVSLLYVEGLTQNSRAIACLNMGSTNMQNEGSWVQRSIEN